MSTPFVCGTGLFGSGIKPGDPDNNIYINAETAYGGIKVSWSYPTVNSHGVAYVRLYRGVNANFSNAIQLGIVSGSVYFDQLKPEADTRYWYWVQLVSVNGTVMEPIGPASAVAKKHAAQVIDQIMQEINEGVLATSLREKIEKITLNYNELQAEIANRVSGNAALSAALAQVQSGVLESLGLINEEITIRTNGQDALASQVNTVAALNATNAAAIIEERTARVTAEGAIATRIDGAYTAAADASAAVVSESIARSNALGALASHVDNVQSEAAGQLSAVQVNMNTRVDTVDGRVTNIGALWTAKVQVNGLVGGFGVYNDGRTVEAGFDVDRFWIGRTGPDRVLPFVVDNDVVYIAKARIKDADIDTLKIAGGAVTTMQTAIAGDVGFSSVSGLLPIVTLNLYGMPVSNGSGVSLLFATTALAGNYATFHVAILRSGTQLVYRKVVIAGDVSTAVVIPFFDPSPNADMCTYTAYVSHESGPSITLTAPAIQGTGGKR